jgi:rRNA biogenesis protein RRP5
MPSTISKPRRTEDGTQPKPTTEPRPMPTFVSTLKAEETDFPRGGGTSLTALEVKQTRDEGRREAEAEDRADVSPFGQVRRMELMIVVKERKEEEAAD